MMRWQRLGFLVVTACTVLILAGSFAAADDKDKPAMAGAWAKKGGEMKIEFGDKGVLKLLPHGDKAGIVITCKYTQEKDGVVKAKITELEANADIKEKLTQIVPVGLEFSFKCKVKDNAATVADVTGEKTDALKSHLEGEYEKK
ncbi:MAG TPA: hypothetical protein VGG61_03060 [Gemmataceae bacterium]